MPYYLGYMHSGRREVFQSAKAPTRASHGQQYKSYRGPMPEVAAHYLKYREENDYPALPTGTNATDLEALAFADQDFYWQCTLVTLTAPEPDVDIQELESAEFNPDLHPEAGYPVFMPAEVNHA